MFPSVVGARQHEILARCTFQAGAATYGTFVWVSGAMWGFAGNLLSGHRHQGYPCSARRCSGRLVAANIAYG